MKEKGLKILFIIILLLICSSILAIVFINKRDTNISLIEEYKVVEYGENYNPKLEELIDLKKYDFIDKSKIKVESNIVNEEGKDYASVGVYQIDVLYEKIKLVQKVEIVDRISPEVSIKEKIEIGEVIDLSKFDFSSFIEISDLSEIKEVNIDYSNIDINKAGEYTAKVIVKDLYDNISEKEFVVVVIEKIKEENETIEVVNKEIKQPIENKNKENKKINTSEKSSNVSNIEKDNLSNNLNSKDNLNENNISNDSNNNITPAPEVKNEITTTEKEQESNKIEDKKEWCYEGGAKHYAGNGPNEHGYYNSFDEALNAAKEQMKNMESGRYKVGECFCGLFYYWLIEE